MIKLDQRFLDSCNRTNCCMNEFVVLPEDGDVGFEEYFDHKLKEVVRAKKIFTPIEQNRLMLAFPKANSRIPHVFEYFYESPMVVAGNHEFEGCFAIDVSDYIANVEEEHFLELISYIKQNNNAVYVLFVCSNDTAAAKKMYDFLTKHIEIRAVNIPLPSAEVLADYTVNNIRQYCLHIERSVKEFLTEHYKEKAAGYDMADHIVRCLKLKDYKGDLQMVKELIDDLNKSQDGDNGFSLGFTY